jgi:hypothetical protein
MGCLNQRTGSPLDRLAPRRWSATTCRMLPRHEGLPTHRLAVLVMKVLMGGAFNSVYAPG